MGTYPPPPFRLTQTCLCNPSVYVPTYGESEDRRLERRVKHALFTLQEEGYYDTFRPIKLVHEFRGIYLWVFLISKIRLVGPLSLRIRGKVVAYLYAGLVRQYRILRYAEGTKI